MPTSLSNGSDYEDEHDIVAEYENQDADGINIDVNSDEDAALDNEESHGRKIDPSTSKLHVVRNPLPKLNAERLKGPKGIQTIEKHFEGFKFYGKGYEKLDLDRVMKRMEHWAHRLFPKLEFDDFVDRLEKLGTKKELQVFVTKYRQDMISAEDDIITKDNMDAEDDKQQDEPIDEFDLLIAEQIEKQKQVVNQSLMSDASTTNDDVFDKLLSESNSKKPQPIVKSSTPAQLSDEVKERIERNRQQAIQRRNARLAAMQEEANRNKMEGIDGTQLEDCSNLQVPDRSENFGNDDFEDNSQGADKKEL